MMGPDLFANPHIRPYLIEQEMHDTYEILPTIPACVEYSSVLVGILKSLPRAIAVGFSA